MKSRPGIAGVTYAFPTSRRSVAELAAAGLLKSDATVLERFGFAQIHVANEESPFELALEAGRTLLREQEIDPETIGLLVYAGASGLRAFMPGDALEMESSYLRTTARFRYPATRLQYELGLSNASVLGVDQLACTGMFGAVRVAAGLCDAEGLDAAMCVSTDFYPPNAGREAIFNCTSDAACAVLVVREAARNRIVASHTVTKGYYWESDSLEDQIVASYFPTACHVIQRTLADAGWSADTVDWVIPHNVSLRSWDVLLRLTGLSNARLWLRNVPRDGHTLAGDNFINLRDAVESGSVAPGERLLFFSYGYGAHWTALALEA